MRYTLQEVADLVDGKVVGNAAAVVGDVAEIQLAKKGSLTFLGNSKYKKYLETTQATAILVPHDFQESGHNLIQVENPNLAFAKMIARFRPLPPHPEPGIHESALVDRKAILGKDIYVGPYAVVEPQAVIENGAVIHAQAYIGQGSRIGARAILHPRVMVYHHCTVGKACIVHSGVVIGSDGYGFVRTGQGIDKIPQAGKVIIGDEVEIGANCTIDRGTLGSTEIGQGTKLDNLVQVGHNVKIGKYCFVVAQVGIAGSTTIGAGVTLAGQVGVAGHLNIGDKAIVAAGSGVTRDVPPGEVVFWYPAREQKQARREIAGIRLLPELRKRLAKLEALHKKKDKSK